MIFDAPLRLRRSQKEQEDAGFMNNIGSLITPAMAAYLVGLTYRKTRTSCLSLVRLCICVSHDALRRGLYSYITCVVRTMRLGNKLLIRLRIRFI